MNNEMTPSQRVKYGAAAGAVGICVNLTLFGLKLAAGLLSGSVAVIADAVNNLSDAGSSIITAISFRMSGKPADSKHPYGHARIEYISGMIVSFVVALLGVELLKTSVEAIITPGEALYSALTYAALVFSMLAKLGLCLFYKLVGRRISSVSLEASAFDSLSDVLSTSVVLIGAVVARFTGIELDGWLGAAVAVFIIVSGVKLIVDTSNPLLGCAPDPEYVKHISSKIMSREGVIGIHDLILHNYGSGREFASAHVEVPASRDILESHDIIDNIENDFLREEGLHLVLHLDPVETDNEKLSQLKADVIVILAGIDEKITMHDFRAVFGTTHTNLIFDICVPLDYPTPDKELCHRISLEVKKLDEKYNTVITVDRSYDMTVNRN